MWDVLSTAEGGCAVVGCRCQGLGTAARDPYSWPEPGQWYPDVMSVPGELAPSLVWQADKLVRAESTSASPPTMDYHRLRGAFPRCQH